MKIRDLNWPLIMVLLVYFLAAILFTIIFTGCSQIIYTDPNGVTIQVNTLLKDVKFDELKIKELVEMKRYTGESKNVKAITPYGVVETSDSNE